MGGQLIPPLTSQDRRLCAYGDSCADSDDQTTVDNEFTPFYFDSDDWDWSMKRLLSPAISSFVSHLVYSVYVIVNSVAVLMTLMLCDLRRPK